MPIEEQCQCSGVGWDSCEPARPPTSTTTTSVVSTTSAVDPSLDYVRTAFRLDVAQRPSLRSLFAHDCLTATLNRQLVSWQAPAVGGQRPGAVQPTLAIGPGSPATPHVAQSPGVPVRRGASRV